MQTMEAKSAARIINHWAGGAFVKEAHFPAGAQIVQHRHHYDHLAYLVRGSVLVLVDGDVHELTGPIGLTIEGGKHHGVRALTDCVWLCIHSIDRAEGESPDDIDVKISQPIDAETVRNIRDELAAKGD